MATVLTEPLPSGLTIYGTTFSPAATPRHREAAMSFVRRPGPPPVSQSGAAAGSVLHGVGLYNRGLRLRVCQDQPRGHDGPVLGQFVILDVGDNKHADALSELAGRLTDAAEVVAVIRRQYRGCVNVANANILVLEPH